MIKSPYRLINFFLVAQTLVIARQSKETESIMRKIAFPGTLFLISSFGLMISCELPSDIGTEFFNTESFDLFPLDSFTVRMSTVRSDSFTTASAERLLIGYHTDETFGSIIATPYLQIGLDSTTTLNEETTKFDSLTISFTYDGYAYFDTTRIMEISLHQIQEEMESDEGFFNTTTFAYNPQSIGSYQFYPKPQKGGDLEFRLTDQFGRQLYNFLIEENEIITNQSKFLDFLPGLVLMPDTLKSSCMLGFSPNQTQLRLYYTDNAELPKKQYIRTFSIGTDDIELSYFNHISSNYTGSMLEAYTDEKVEVLESSGTNGKAFLQGGSGLSLRTEFPYLQNILETEVDFIVSKATLRFTPAVDFPTEANNLMDALIARIIDDNNDFLVTNGANANLVFDAEFGRDTYYEIDVTDFTKALIYNELDSDYALSLDAQFSTSSVDRLIIDELGEFEPKLTLFLLKIK